MPAALPGRLVRPPWTVTVAFLVASLALHGCVSVREPSLHETTEATTLGKSKARREQALKVHLVSGELVVLTRWGLAPSELALEGEGERYDATRALRSNGPMSVSLDQVALLETNDSHQASLLAQVGLATLTTFWGTASVVCAIDPKSCFGSCPTFYGEDAPERPLAEGFSSSIARALEARDLDALGDVTPPAGRLTLVMKNEALETHAVRRVRLRTVERPRGSRVYATSEGAFRPLTDPMAPSTCRGAEGDCGPALSLPDVAERSSAADAADLATREELVLSFPRRPPKAGLVIRARQTLLTTFLFYQTLGYLGRDAGAYLAALERGGGEQASRAMGMARLLGGIEVEVEDEGLWRRAGAFDEAGPIASDTQVLPLPVTHGERSRPLLVRLRMAKGHYRIDWVALGEIGGELHARVVEADAVEKDGRPNARALALLREGGQHLITLPGDEYRISFSLPPDDGERDVFLESEGYYYEWMREDWLREQDLGMALLVLRRPAEGLKRLAAAFKAQEARADAAFWGSRFEKRTQ